MKKGLLFILLIALACGLSAQQDAMITQFFSNKLTVNPAYAGSRDALSIVILARNQWTGFKGAPKTQTLSVHTPLRKLNSGVGLTLIHDKLGIENSFFLSGSYSYTIPFETSRLSFGLNGQVKRHFMDWSSTSPVNVQDPSIPYGYNLLVLPNVGTGVYLSGSKYYAGISVPHIIEHNLDFDPTDTQVRSLAQLKRHYFAMAGVVLSITKDIKIKPAGLVKVVGNAPVQFDANLMFIFKDALWAGASYRHGDSMDFILQYHLNDFMRIGYSYDYSVTRLNQFHTGSHEIMIGFDILKERGGFYHSRYF